MSKLGVFALFSVIGAAAYMILIMYYPPFVTLIRGIPINLTQIIADPIGTLTQHWQILASGVTGFAGAGTLITLVYNQLYKRAKQAQQALTTEKVAEANNLAIAKTSEAANYKQQLESAQQEVATLKQTNTNITETQQAYTRLEGKYQTLQNEYTTMEKTLQNTINDLKQKPQVIVK